VNVFIGQFDGSEIIHTEALTPGEQVVGGGGGAGFNSSNLTSPSRSSSPFQPLPQSSSLQSQEELQQQESGTPTIRPTNSFLKEVRRQSNPVGIYRVPGMTAYAYTPGLIFFFLFFLFSIFILFILFFFYFFFSFLQVLESWPQEMKKVVLSFTCT
jgi:hypothetical protein